MSCRTFGVAVLLAGYFLTVPSFATDEEEGEAIRDTTQQFRGEDSQAMQGLARAGFFQTLQPFALDAKAATSADVKASLTMPSLQEGEPNKKYDIILQPGHYLRKKGSGKNLGTAGKDVTEQQLVAFITANVATHLIDNKLNVIVVSADGYKSGLSTDIFLSIHADGSTNECGTGPSLGYSEESSLLGMHGIAFALATSLGQTYEDFRDDNFTTNLSKYYMFKHVKVSPKGFAGLLEVGELTCPAKEKALIANALLIAKNLGVALKSSHEIIKEPLDSK
ncbi:hypothetical protein NKZ35_25385 [Sinorhizobium meliloti]|uniref:hypothetical protein n=1 Tax=Rhizobium meliloti TaxID=382 RepID=UPI003D6480F0